MGLLDSFLGSDKNLRGPDFEKAPWLELDFSGTKLRFKDPQHTAMYPINVFAEDMDVFDKTYYKRQKEGELIKTFYEKGWVLKGRKEHGGVDITGRIFFFDQIPPGQINLFCRSSFAKEILEFCHVMWGGKKERLEKSGEEISYVYKYPTDESLLCFSNINQIDWLYFTAQRPGDAPRLFFSVPISPSHMLMLSFTLGAYHDTDFYNPATNLEQASYKLVDDFMRNFYIELSSETKAQKAAAEKSI